MKVQVTLFTGKVVGEYEAIKNADGNYEVSFKDGQLGIFNPESLKQQNAVKPQFACKMIILADDTAKAYPIKLSEMNGHQRIAARQIRYAINDIVGGLENTTYDYPVDSEAYQNATATLEDHELLTAMVYDGIMECTYGEGWVHCRPTDEVKFAGKDFLMNYIDYRLKREGY